MATKNSLDAQVMGDMVWKLEQLKSVPVFDQKTSNAIQNALTVCYQIVSSLQANKMTVGKVYDFFCENHLKSKIDAGLLSNGFDRNGNDVMDVQTVYEMTLQLESLKNVSFFDEKVLMTVKNVTTLFRAMMGSLESQDSTVAKQYIFFCENYLHGKIADGVLTAI